MNSMSNRPAALRTPGLRRCAGHLAATALSLLLGACSGERIVHEPPLPEHLQAVEARISDEAIRHDRQVIERLRGRLRALSDSGRWPLDNYAVCKALAWIDFAETEYTDNDRGTVVDSALAQARALIGAMEAGSRQIDRATPPFAETLRVRPDLWEFVARTKASAAGACSDCDLARLEVQLVAAGHDHWELGWRHAVAGLQAAERYQRAVQRGLEACPAGAGAPSAEPQPAEGRP